MGAGLGLYELRDVPLVDREPQREALWGALRRVHQGGAPVALVLRGRSGYGKSRLARWLCESAHGHGVATVVGPIAFALPTSPAPAQESKVEES